MSNLAGKNIILGVTGCIAAYKSAELVRLLVKAGAHVDIIMTDAAQQFVTPLTFSTLSRRRVYTQMFEQPEEYSIDHISLADRADMLIVAPVTANVIGKIAHGIADDLLTTTVMATKAPVFLAPAMNTNMWNNAIVQQNIQTLKQQGYNFINPDSGELACGYSGDGRLKDINEIFNQIEFFFNVKTSLKGKKVLITMGGTREYIDPVRFITNKSSGKMGLALACAAKEHGAQVTVISTVPVKEPGVDVIMVETAQQMLEQATESFMSSDILIMAAAVADYRPETSSDSKQKKNSKTDKISLNLIKNPDIIATLAQEKKQNQVIVGFCAETENLLVNAEKKLRSKNLNVIVANDVSRSDIGMNADDNEVTLLFSNGQIQKIEKNTKKFIAYAIIQALLPYC